MLPNWSDILSTLQSKTADEVKKLLEAEFHGKTILMIAVENREYTIVQAILDSKYFHSAIMNKQYQSTHNTALLTAVEMQDLTMVKAMVHSAHCNIQTLTLRNLSGRSPLTLSWHKQVHSDIVDVIVKATPSPNLRKTHHFFGSKFETLAKLSLFPVATSVSLTTLAVANNNYNEPYDLIQTVKYNAGTLALSLISFLITVPLTVVTLGLSLVCAIALTLAAPVAFAIAGIKDGLNQSKQESTSQTPLLC